MREPVAAMVYLRAIASNSVSRVFSRAQTSARPEETMDQPVHSASPTFAIGCDHRTGPGVLAEEVILRRSG